MPSPISTPMHTAFNALASPLQRFTKPNSRRLVIAVCATGEYARPMWVQAHAVAHAVREARLEARGIAASVCMVGDGLQPVAAHWRRITGLPVDVFEVSCEIATGASLPRWNYSHAAQLLIASMRDVTFHEARDAQADWLWSLDSDVFPSPHALASSLDALALFGGYYSIAASPYPSQGGGSYLCGRGEARDPIHADFAIHERRCPKLLVWLHARFEAWHGRLAHGQGRDAALRKHGRDAHATLPERIARAGKWLRDRINQYPPTASIWELQARGYRRRGWFDFAYPGIGQGALVPSDWCGMGCTLLDRSALAVSQFSLGTPGGYDGGGTEDLFLCYRRWLPAGLRIAALAGAPSTHASRDKQHGYMMHRASFETLDAECRGHLRRHNVPLDWRCGQTETLLPRAFFEA